MLTASSVTASDNFIHSSFIHIIPTTIMAVFLNLLCWGGIICCFILLIRALRKYLSSGEVRKESAAVRKSLGEALKEHRTRCHMTQEFVAEHLGVSRQAVSKWENVSSDPGTANLLALAKLYGIEATELLKEVQEQP